MKFEAGKEIADLELRRIPGIGTVNHIVFDVGPEILPDRFGGGLFRIGGPHEITMPLDNILPFQYDDDHWSL